MKVEIGSQAWFKADDLSADQLIWLKKNLTITQKVSKEYQKRSKPAIVQLWTQDADRIGIPREFFFDTVKRNQEISYSSSRGEAWPARLDDPRTAEVRTADSSDLALYDSEIGRPIILKPEQQEALQAVKERFATRPVTGALVQAPTGWGKTLLGLAMIKEFKLKTAVVVHREFLLNQWKARLARYLPEAKVGIIAGKQWETDDCHVVLVMIETIASWAKKGKMPPELGGMFGLVVYDEIHRVGAPTWSLAVPALNSAYRVGISAHPRRSDGLDKVFFYHIGPKVYTGVTLSRTPRVRRVYSSYTIKHQRANLSFMSMEYAFKLMSADPVYNQDVIEQIKLALEKGRKIFVYSHTVKHLKLLKEELDNQWKQSPIKTDFYIGGMTEDELAESEKADVIFGTYQMAKDSLDIPALDTVVLAGPIRNPTQPAGRCCRDYPNKKDPIVVDMRADNVQIFKEYGESRDRTYEKIYGNQAAPNQNQQTISLEVSDAQKA